VYVKTDLKFAALHHRNLRRTKSEAGKTTIKPGGCPPHRREFASFVRYPAEARAIFFLWHSTAPKDFHGR
jgi:hypothetical protein